MGELDRRFDNVIEVNWEDEPLSDQYDADYFLRGKQTGKSLYEQYRWMPELTIPMVRAIINHLCIKASDTILDFGCARGYTVKAFRQLGYQAFGLDISEWAIRNADPEVREFVSMPVPGWKTRRVVVDWVIAKDVLEHVDYLGDVVNELMASARRGIFVVVPLSNNGCTYVVPEYEQDTTHIHRMSLLQWTKIFTDPQWSCVASYRLNGVKDNYAHYPAGNGFITCRRLPQ